jgi:hypothetical protein
MAFFNGNAQNANSEGNAAGKAPFAMRQTTIFAIRRRRITALSKAARAPREMIAP